MGRSFDWLGVGIVRHPWYAVTIWIAIVLVAVPVAAGVGAVISSSFGNVIPSTDESVIAQNEFTAEFPNATGSPSSALVLLEMPRITGPIGRNATIALTQAYAADRNLEYVQSIETLYTVYGEYLAGQAALGLAFLEPSLHSDPSLPEGVNLTASLLWVPVREYVENWQTEVQLLPAGTPASSANGPAFNMTEASLASDPMATRILSTFYNGFNVTVPGFNRTVTDTCLNTRNISPCADTAARSTLAPLLPSLLPGAANETEAAIVLGNLGVENLTCWSCIQQTGADLLGDTVGLPPAWVDTLWQAFPSDPPQQTIAAWAMASATGSLDPEYLVPMPEPLRATFVNPSDSASIIVVNYRVSDTFTANGSTPTFHDDTELGIVTAGVLGSSVAYSQIAYHVTGSSPVSSAISNLATSALSVLLLLTVIVLIAIMIAYFRAPAAPLISFAAIGIALLVSLGLVFVAGRLVTTFNPEVESILLVFVMSIGTDYTVFLMARYREELVRGASSPDAVRTTVRWAGQSIITSGLTVAVVTSAMMFTGIGMMTQFGLVLTIGVLVTLAVALTIVPAILRLAGPRVFWPYTGARFQSYAARRRRALESSEGYVARAGRAATRHPWWTLGLILILSAPVVYVAFTVPVSYDISNIGLPPSNPAQEGFNALNQEFGAGYISTSYVLVTFSAPIVVGNEINATEMRDISAVSNVLAETPGIASVRALAGGSGPPLSYWQEYSTLPPAQQATAQGMFGEFVGVNDRTVVFDVTTNATGYSLAAVGAMDRARDGLANFETHHSEIASIHYGGAAQTTGDLQQLVNRTNQDMLIGAALGLFVMLLAILGSAFVPALALGAIGLSILWGWAGTYFVVGILEGEALMFLLPLLLLILILGLGMDYNVLLLTRVREERAKGGTPEEAVRRAVANAGGVIAAAAVILGGAFLLLGLTSPLAMLAGMGLGIGIAVLLQAFVVQMYLTPAVLALGKDRIWKGWTRPGEGASARDA